MNATAIKPTRAIHLTQAQRQDLIELIAANPLATCTRIAALFKARTGRRVSESTVQRVWVLGYKPTDPGDCHRNLTEAERAILTRLCQEAAPEYRRTEIARRFEAEAGRAILPYNVSKFIRTRLGIADRKPPGRPPGKVVAR